jgi:hypothetical protein
MRRIQRNVCAPCLQDPEDRSDHAQGLHNHERDSVLGSKAARQQAPSQQISVTVELSIGPGDFSVPQCDRVWSGLGLSLEQGVKSAQSIIEGGGGWRAAVHQPVAFRSAQQFEALDRSIRLVQGALEKNRPLLAETIDRSRRESRAVKMQRYVGSIIPGDALKMERERKN